MKTEGGMNGRPGAQIGVPGFGDEDLGGAKS